VGLVAGRAGALDIGAWPSHPRLGFTWQPGEHSFPRLTRGWACPRARPWGRGSGQSRADPDPGPAGVFEDVAHGRAGRADIEEAGGRELLPRGGDEANDLLAEAIGDAAQVQYQPLRVVLYHSGQAILQLGIGDVVEFAVNRDRGHAGGPVHADCQWWQVPHHARPHPPPRSALPGPGGG